MDNNFNRLKNLPIYVFNEIQALKADARKRGVDIIDFGMGNPDQATPIGIVNKLIDSALVGSAHRYSQSNGIPRLRKAICDWYYRKYNVLLDSDSEAIVTMGSKEGLSHLALATINQGDYVLVPNPSYPIHFYGFIIAGAKLIHIPVNEKNNFLLKLEYEINNSSIKPKMIVLNFPSNPSTDCIEIDFFEKVIEIARKYKIWVINDLAYGDICFDNYKAPSILQVQGAKDLAVEFYTMSKSYNMPGWRVGFCCGNKELINALAKIKSYYDYGIFTPIQVAAVKALDDGDDLVNGIKEMYQKRRDILVRGLNDSGWNVISPKATMFVWAKIPLSYQKLGSLEFSKKLLNEAKVVVSPGVGFGDYGEGFIRFSLIENEQRIRQAIRNIKRVIKV